MFDSGWEDGPGPEPTWSSRAPGAELATALEASEPLGIGVDDGFDAAERLGAWEALAAWAMARQLQEAAEYLQARQARERQCSRDLDDARLAVAMELATYARVAPTTGEHRLAHASALLDRLPGTLDALRRGSISYSHARVVIDQTAACGDEMAQRVDATLWGRPPRDRTPTQLREAVRRIVLRLDPENLRRRQVRAQAERTVRYWADDDGATGVIHVRMPAPEARGVYAVVDALARAAGDDDDDAERRTLGNRRADVLRDLVLQGALGGQPTHRPRPTGPTAQPTGPTGPTGVARPAVEPAAESAAQPNASSPPSPASPVKVVVRITIPWQTAAGLSDEPADLEGHGPIPAEQARAMASGADATWLRLLTDPVTGVAEHLDTRRYRPPRRLAEFVRARDRTCAAPGCRVPAARCDLDHVVAYDHTAPGGDGGPSGRGATSARNLRPGCRRDHRIKTHTGWSCDTVPDPAGARAPVLRWTSPTGRAWLVRAPQLAEPLVPEGTEEESGVVDQRAA